MTFKGVLGPRWSMRKWSARLSLAQRMRAGVTDITLHCEQSGPPLWPFWRRRSSITWPPLQSLGAVLMDKGMMASDG